MFDSDHHRNACVTLTHICCSRVCVYYTARIVANVPNEMMCAACIYRYKVYGIYSLGVRYVEHGRGIKSPNTNIVKYICIFFRSGFISVFLFFRFFHCAYSIIRIVCSFARWISPVRL